MANSEKTNDPIRLERLLAKIDSLEAEQRILKAKQRARPADYLKGMIAGKRMWQGMPESNSRKFEFRAWQAMTADEQQATHDMILARKGARA